MKEKQRPTAMLAMSLQIVVSGQFDHFCPIKNYTTSGGRGGHDNQC